MLCEVCHKLVPILLEAMNIEVVGTEQASLFEHHKEPLELHQSAASGCHICSVIWGSYTLNQQSVLLDEPYDSTLEWITRALMFRYENKNVRAKVVFVSGADRKFGMTSVQTCFEFESALLNSPLENESKIEQSTGSETSWQLAQGWLKDCTINHPECSVYSHHDTWCPNRLLEISEDHLRLVEFGDDATRNLPYLTLSHCWGKTEFLKLSTDSYDHLCHGLDPRELPKTFRDFVLVARRLKIQHVWIDCLCIRQDSKEDWFRESALMGRIYSNALCNIAATGACDSTDGLFHSRDVDTLRLPSFEIRQTEDAPSNILKLFNTAWWDCTIGPEPLTCRAWVLQERLLARRVLHFGKKQVLFECRRSIACEMFPKGEANRTFFSSGSSQCSSLWDLGYWSRLPNAQFLGLLPAGMWQQIVRTYSTAHLSVGTDKAIAISGIAKRIQKIFKVKYIAGMWTINLHYHLSWAALHPCKSSPSYRAPSFSWLSVDGVINYFDKPDAVIASTILDIQIDPVTSDRTGALQGGFLRMKGTLRRLAINFHTFDATVNDRSLLAKMFWVHLDNSQDRQQDVGYVGHFYIMNLAYGWQASPGLMRSISCLMLLPVDTEAGTYRRVGLFHHPSIAITSFGEEFSRPPPGVYSDNHAADEEQFPCEEYDPVSREHTIKII